VTNAPFRLVARECGAGLLTSEEIDARALVQGNGHTVALARFLPEEHPIAMQLLGSDPDVLAEAARRLEAAGAARIDLNMGCRGALGAPWIFTGRAVSRAEQAQIIRRHSALIEAHLDPRTALVQLKKHLAWYANGLPFAAQIRAELFAAPSAAAVSDAFWRLW